MTEQQTTKKTGTSPSPAPQTGQQRGTGPRKNETGRN